jgi:hypothetical protein
MARSHCRVKRVRPPRTPFLNPLSQGVTAPMWSAPVKGHAGMGPLAGLGWLAVVSLVRAAIVGGEGLDEVAELPRMHPFGPRGGGVRMTVESGPGLLSQLNGRVAGSCKDASAPGRGLSTYGFCQGHPGSM